MSQKDYQRAAGIVQGTPAGYREAVRDAFVELFREPGSRFDVERFKRACEPGANVRARS